MVRYILCSGVLAIGIMLASCEKEPRKVDINDGNENPINRKLEIEVTHRYSNTQDSLLPRVAVTLYETEEDEQLGRYYRRDTTGAGGVIVFGQIKTGDFRIVLSHATLGIRKKQVKITSQMVSSYEYYYF